MRWVRERSSQVGAKLRHGSSLRQIAVMRKLLALAIAFFFVLQSTAALAAPVELCCLEDCNAMSCSVAVCQACTAPAAVEGLLGELIPKPLGVQFSAGNEFFPDSAHQEIWRPPD